MDLCVAEGSSGLRRLRQHAEFQAERSGCARHIGLPDRQQHGAGGRRCDGAGFESQPDPTAAASLYGESFCASCHAVQNAAGNVVGGDVGPELTRVGSKVKPEWLQAWLRNPRGYDPKRQCRTTASTNSRLRLLGSSLENKTDSDLLANVHLDAATPEQIAHGKTLVTEYGCAACHEISGIKKPENFAPELTRIGSKPLDAVDISPGDAAYACQITLRQRSGSRDRSEQALKMPQFSFAPAQVDALTTALLSLTDRSSKSAAAL